MLSYKKKRHKNGWRRMWLRSWRGEEMERWRGEEDEKEKSGRDLVFTSRADPLQRCYLAELSLRLPLSRLLHSWPPQSFSPCRSPLSRCSHWFISPSPLASPSRSSSLYQRTTMSGGEGEGGPAEHEMVWAFTTTGSVWPHTATSHRHGNPQQHGALIERRAWGGKKG